jgi:hypothetical protein
MKRAVASIALALATIVLTAGPASAHTGKVVATNYRSVITDNLHVTGVHVRLVEAGGRVEVVNHASFDVVVLGYQDEPYLRIGPRGTDENRRSPAVALNATRAGGATPPADADANAAPEWVHISDAPVARWHDHRTHFMGGTALADRVTPWTLHLRVDGTTMSVRGELIHEAGPASWPWIVVALVLAVAVALGGRRTLLAAAALLVVLDVVRVSGLSLEVAGPVSAKLSQAINVGAVDAVGWVLGVFAVVRLVARKHDGALAAGVTGVLLCIVGGVLEWGDLGKSQLAVVTPPLLHRLCVAGVAGVGLGVAAAVLVETGRVPTKPAAKRAAR